MSHDQGGVTALQVAIAAGALLVALVGADVVFTATSTLEIRTEDGWRTLATLPADRDRFDRPEPLIEVNRSEELTFRLSVDNQRPIGFSEPYRVHVHGDTLDQGRLSAAPMGTAEATFTVTGEVLLGSDRGSPDAPPGASVRGVPFELVVGDDRAHGFAEVREVAR